MGYGSSSGIEPQMGHHFVLFVGEEQEGGGRVVVVVVVVVVDEGGEAVDHALLDAFFGGLTGDDAK